MPSKKPDRSNAATTPKSSEELSSAQSLDLDIKLLLEPKHAARTQFDEVKLHELIESIRNVGLLEPLVVYPEGDYFRIAAGHRRYVAVSALEWKIVPCRVFPNGRAAWAALMHHENRFREDLNPADEARHFAMLLEEQCDGDVDKLCALVHERRGYVEDRLLLCIGDTKIFDALAAGAIGVGVAGELNKVTDPERRQMYLDAAMRGGATVGMVRQWRVQGNAQDQLLQALREGEAPVTSEHVSDHPKQSLMQCVLCQSDSDQWDMEVLFAHKSCLRVREREREAHEHKQPEQSAG